ncbi:MAG: phage tail length tape measure family protein, partial [Hylemonella sp.]
MADTVERVRVIIEADGTARLVDGTRLSAEEMRKLGESLSNTGDKLESVGARSEKTGQQLAGMGRDIAQGDWRGAAENMGRMALSSGAAQAAASGLGVALGVGATALVAWGVAMYQAREETERQANVMLLTGNYAGLVSGELNQAARDVAAGINGSVGNTRQTMEALVATGRVTNQSLAEMARGVEL